MVATFTKFIDRGFENIEWDSNEAKDAQELDGSGQPDPILTQELYAGPEHHEALMRQELDASGDGGRHFSRELEGSSPRPSITIKRKAVGSGTPSEVPG